MKACAHKYLRTVHEIIKNEPKELRTLMRKLAVLDVAALECTHITAKRDNCLKEQDLIIQQIWERFPERAEYHRLHR